MPAYCLSDLHLHDDEQPYLFTREKERVFVQLAAEADRAGGTILFGGDVLDLTGMQPPERGLRRFYDAVLGPGAHPPHERPRSIGDRVAAVAARFPDFFTALRPFAAGDRLRFILGNHDIELHEAGGRAALGRALGIPAEKVHFSESTALEGGVLVGTHGHQWDEANQTPQNAWRNPGAALTAVLYHALQPALKVLGLSPRSAWALPAVRPEENAIADLESLIGDPDTVQRLLVAFVVILDDNGYFRDADVLTRLAIEAAERGLFQSTVINAERVKKTLRDRGGMRERLADEAARIRALTWPAPRVVAMGHTHDFDGGPEYVNLGTWIDHVTGLDEADLTAADRTLPVLLVDGARAAVHDATQLLERGELAACPRMWPKE